MVDIPVTTVAAMAHHDMIEGFLKDGNMKLE
jgi:hypothetical protein